MRDVGPSNCIVVLGEIDECSVLGPDLNPDRIERLLINSPDVCVL